MIKFQIESFVKGAKYPTEFVTVVQNSKEVSLSKRNVKGKGGFSDYLDKKAQSHENNTFTSSRKLKSVALPL
jgi:hypothetical protein